MEVGLIVLGTVAGALAVVYYTGGFSASGATRVSFDVNRLFDDLFGNPQPQVPDFGVSPAGPTSTTLSMTVRELAARLSELEIFARTIWGEARGEGVAGMRAVAAVIMNRVASSRYPGSVRGVCLQPFQFSVWNDDDVNGPRALAVGMSDAAYVTALETAQLALVGRLSDPTGGALHYAASSIRPSWARGAQVSAVIGNHTFYVGVA